MKKVIRLTERDLTRLVKKIIKEGFSVDGIEDFDFPDDPNDFDKWCLEEIFKVANDVDEANDMIEDHYPGYYFEEKRDTGYGKTIAFMSPEGEEIVGRYILGCCGGRGESENLDKFKRSDDAFYNPHKRY